MAQQVVIAGALFNDVPSISVPDSNSVWHPFVDPSVTTAAASDVASGKLFIASDGTLTTGTASGGGGTSIVWGTIRGDATLVKSWTYDKLIHEDEGVTIPSYSTSNQTLKSGSALTSESLNYANYDYILIFRFLAMPVYSNATGSGHQICWFSCGMMPIPYVRASAFSYNGNAATAATSGAAQSTLSPVRIERTMYLTSSNPKIANVNYGPYMTLSTNPSVTTSTTSPYSTGSLTVTSPNLVIRGSNTYMNSTNWGYMTDIRYQYIFDLYRVPSSAAVQGWEIESQVKHVADCVNGDGTLT